MNYQQWLASLDSSIRQHWFNMVEDDCPAPVLADWVEDNGGLRWFAKLVEDGKLGSTASEYTRWTELGMESLLTNGCMEFCNQEPNGADCNRGDWYIADDASLTIVWGTFGSYNSPGDSHYTYGTVFASESDYKTALAEWEAKPEWLETDDQDDDDTWQENDEADEGGDWAEDDYPYSDADIPF